MIGLLLAAAALSTSGGAAAAQEPPPAAREAETLLDVPFLPQSELLCGGAAAAMVLRYWGAREVDAEEFRPLVRPEEGGIRGGELAAELRRRGWRALSFAGDSEEVRAQIERGRPVVALLEVEPDRFHFVVVVAWTDRGVVYHDPARAPFRVRSPAEFDEAWRASGRWTLVVLPSGERADDDRSGADADPARPPAGSPQPERQTSAPDGSACAEDVREAVERARRGDLAAADELLSEAVRRCPGSARARVELAGLRARQERWPEARERARQAVELDPAMDHAWRILATARFLTDDRLGALAAWNNVREPRILDVRVDGLDRTRFEPVRGRLALQEGELLTPTSFRRASRRLALLPVAAATRLRYLPTGDGGARVQAALLERPLLPNSLAAWAVIAVRGAVIRDVSVDVAGPAGAGELWTAAVRYEEHRPRVALEVDVPAPPLVPGVVTVGAAWERQTFDTGAAADTTVEERRAARMESTDWITARLRWRAGLAVERWKDGPTDGALSLGLELRSLSDRLSIRSRGLLAISLAGDPERSYARASLGASWRSSAERSGAVLHLRATGTAVSREAPLSFWPGAGGGRARDGLLRAHPLLRDGIVVGPAFGRVLLHGGAEARWWFPAPWGLKVAPATFVDVARPWRRPIPDEGRLEVDAGAGLRLSAPGRAGVVRVDAARGLRTGGWHLEAGFDAPWPGVGIR